MLQPFGFPVQPTSGTSNPTLDPEVHLSERLLEEYDSIQRPWSQKAIDNRAFVHNMQFTPAQKKVLESRNQMAEPVNVLLPAVDTTVSILSANNPKFQVTPAEGSDRDMAEVWRSLFDWIWHGQPGATTQDDLAQSIRDFIETGRGVMLAYQDMDADYGQGEIRIIATEPLKWYPSPNTKDRYWRDAQHLLYSDLMTAQQVIDRYGPSMLSRLRRARQGFYSRIPSPSYSYQSDSPQRSLIGPFQDPILSSYVAGSEGLAEPKFEVIERYTKVLRVVHLATNEEGVREEVEDSDMQAWLEHPVLVVTDGQRQSLIGDRRQIQRLVATALMSGERTGERDFIIPGTDQTPAIAIRLSNRRELLAQGMLSATARRMQRVRLLVSAGGVRLLDKTLPTSEYPVFPLQNRWNRNPYPESDVTFARPMQMELNKVHIQILSHAATSTGPLVLIPKGGHDIGKLRQQAMQAGMKILEIDMELGSPVVVQPQQLNAAFFTLAERIKEYINELLGIWPFMQGNPQNLPTNQPYRSTLTMEENSARRHNPKLRVIYGALQVGGRSVIDLAQNLYKREKVLSLVQPNGVIEETPINKLIYEDFSGAVRTFNDVTRGRYDLRVVAGSTLPTSRMAKEERNLQLLAAGLIDDIEALKHMEGIDVEGVLERKSLYSQMQGMIEELEENVKELSGDLQTARRGEVIARMGQVLANFRASVKTNQANVQARMDKAADLFEARLADQLQLQRQQNQLTNGQRTASVSQPARRNAA